MGKGLEPLLPCLFARAPDTRLNVDEDKGKSRGRVRVSIR